MRPPVIVGVLGLVIAISAALLVLYAAAPPAPARGSLPGVGSTAPPPGVDAGDAGPRRRSTREAADRARGALDRHRGDSAPDEAPPRPGAAEVHRGAEAASSASASAPAGSDSTKPPRRYVQDVVREQFVPMARGCYEALLVREPELGGTLVLDFVIAGDASVGGVVDHVEVAEGSSLTDAEFVTCMRESMYSVVFDPPPEGHRFTTVRYPFTLAP